MRARDDKIGYPIAMQRLRAALLGCLLTGGVLFGARPTMPRDAGSPIFISSDFGPRDGVSPEALVRWFRPMQPGATVTALRAQAGLASPEPAPNAGDLWQPQVWDRLLAVDGGAVLHDDRPTVTAVPRTRIRCIERVERHLRRA